MTSRQFTQRLLLRALAGLLLQDETWHGWSRMSLWLLPAVIVNPRGQSATSITTSTRRVVAVIRASAAAAGYASHTIGSVELAKLIDLRILLVELHLLLLDGSSESLNAMLQICNGLLRLNALAAHGLLEVRVLFLQALVVASHLARLPGGGLRFQAELLQQKPHSAAIVVNAL